MKEINDQLYGYSYELDTTSEDNGTKCFAVDTGTVFVAYKGVWYEQPGSFWAASISEGEDDLFGLSWEIGKIIPDDDLVVLNAVDTGKRYVSFNGKWYEQPVQWSAPAAGGGGGGGGSELPAVTADDNGDVLTVVSGAWGKADPPAALPSVTSSDNDKVLTVVNGAWAKSTKQSAVVGTTVTTNSQKLTKTWSQIYSGGYAVIEDVATMMDDYKTCYYITAVYNDVMEDAYVVKAINLTDSTELTFTTYSQSGYPSRTISG